MKGLKPKQKAALFQSNCRTHFKMYKAGRRWLIAGISILSGLLGGLETAKVAQAQTLTPGKSKQLAPQAVAATQKSGTIPATSQSTSQETSGSDQTSLSGHATVQSTARVAPSTSVATPSQQPDTAVSQSVTPSDATANPSVAQVAAAQTSASTAPNASTAQTSATSGTLLATSEQPAKSVAAQAPTLAPQRLAAQLPTAPQGYAFSFETNVPATQTPVSTASYVGGQQQAQADIDGIVSHFTSTGLAGLTHITWHLGDIPSTSTEITTAIQKVSALIDLYYNHENFQADDQYGTPVWINGTQPTTTPKKFQYKDFDLGYADYLRAFAQGVSEWAASIGTRAKDPQLVNDLIDDKDYDPTQLSGTNLLGTLGTAGSITGDWLAGLLPQNNDMDGILGYQATNNMASESIQATAKAIDYYVSIVAPIVINGIAHQALSDIRSIGGHLQDDDYAPAKLTQAVQLNGNLAYVLKAIGLSNVLGTTIVQKVYEGIRANAQAAIEQNWTIGAQKALAEFAAGTMATEETADYATVPGYSQTNPADILDKATGQPLSQVAQAAGYAWYEKVLSAVLVEAGNDAEAGQPKADLTAIVTALRGNDTADKASQTVLSADQINEILQPNGEVAHAFLTTDNQQNAAVDNYTRNSIGVQTVIDQLYHAEYQAIHAAIVDYQQKPNATLDQIKAQQAQYVYHSPADNNTMAMNDYQRTYQLLQSTDAFYQGQLTADQQIASLKGAPVALSADALNSTADDLVSSWGMMLGLMTATNGYTFITPNTALLKQCYLNAYQAEFARISQAYQAGQNLAQQNYQAAKDGLIPDTQHAGSYQGLDATNDGVSVLYPSLQGTTENDAGQAFTKGYQQNLAAVTVNVTTGAADQQAFTQTPMATGQQTVYTLKGKAATLTAPQPIPGWVVDQDQQKIIGGTTSSVTFTYHRAITLRQLTLPTQTPHYDGRLASAQLQAVTVTPSWTDQLPGQAITLGAQDVTVDAAEDAAKVGQYHYHLTQAGAQALLTQLRAQQPDTHHVLPSLTELMALTGQLRIIQAQDAAHLPQLTTRPVTVVAGQTPTAAELVATALDAQGQPLTPANATVGTADWSVVGPHTVTVTLADPTSNQQVAAPAEVTVISQESSTSAWSSQVSQSQSFSALDSADASASDALLSATSQLKSTASTAQSLSAWSQTVAQEQSSLATVDSSLTSRLTSDQSVLTSRNVAQDSRLLAAQESAVSSVVASLAAASGVTSATASLVSQRVASLSQWSLSVEQHHSQVTSQRQSQQDQSLEQRQSLQASQSISQSDRVSQQRAVQSTQSRIKSQLDAETSLSQALISQIDHTSQQLAQAPDSQTQQSLFQQLSTERQSQGQSSLALASTVVTSQSLVLASVADHQGALAQQATAMASATTSMAQQSLANLNSLTSVSQAEASLSQLLSADRSLSVTSQGRASLSQLAISVASVNSVASGMAQQAASLMTVAQGQAPTTLPTGWTQAQTSLTHQSNSQLTVTTAQDSVQASLVDMSLAAASGFDSTWTSLLDKSLLDHPNLPENQQSALTSLMTSLSQATDDRDTQWHQQQAVATHVKDLAQQKSQALATVLAHSQQSLAQVTSAVNSQSMRLDDQAASQLTLTQQASLQASQQQKAAHRAWVTWQQASQTMPQQQLSLTSEAVSLSQQSVSLASQSVQAEQSQISLAQTSLAAVSAWFGSRYSLTSMQQTSVSDWSERMQTELSDLTTAQSLQGRRAQSLTAMTQQLSVTSASVAAQFSEFVSASVASLSQVAASQSATAQQMGVASQSLTAQQHAQLVASQAEVVQHQTEDAQWHANLAVQTSLVHQQASLSQLATAQTSAQWSVIQDSLSARSAVEVAQQSLVEGNPVASAGTAGQSLSVQSQADASERRHLQALATSQAQRVTALTSLSQATASQVAEQQASLRHVITSVTQQQQTTATQQASLATVVAQASQSEQSALAVVSATRSALTSTQAAVTPGQSTSAQLVALTSVATSLALQSLSEMDWQLTATHSLMSLTLVGQSTQSQALDRQAALTSLMEASASAQSLQLATQVTTENSETTDNRHRAQAIASVTTQVKTAVRSLNQQNQTLAARSLARGSQLIASQSQREQDLQSLQASLAQRASQRLSAQQVDQQDSLTNQQQWGPAATAVTSGAVQNSELTSEAQLELAAQQSEVALSLSAQSQFTQSQASLLTAVHQSLSQLATLPAERVSELAVAQASLSQQRLTDERVASQAASQSTSLMASLTATRRQSQLDQSRQRSLSFSLHQVVSAQTSESLWAVSQEKSQLTIMATVSQANQADSAALSSQAASLAQTQTSLLAQPHLTLRQSLALTSATTRLSLASVSETDRRLATAQAATSFAQTSETLAAAQTASQAALVSLVTGSVSAAVIHEQVQHSIADWQQKQLGAGQQSLDSLTQALSLTSQSLVTLASQTASAASSLAVSSQLTSQFLNLSTARQHLQEQASAASQAQSLLAKHQGSLAGQTGALTSLLVAQSEQSVSALISQDRQASQRASEWGTPGWTSVATSLSQQLVTVASQWRQQLAQSQSERSLSVMTSQRIETSLAAQRHQQSLVTQQSQAVVSALTSVHQRLQASQYQTSEVLSAVDSQLALASTASLSLGTQQHSAAATTVDAVTSLTQQADRWQHQGSALAVGAHSLAQVSESEVQQSLQEQSQRETSQRHSLTQCQQQEQSQQQALGSLANAVSEAEQSLSQTSQAVQSTLISQSEAHVQQVPNWPQPSPTVSPTVGVASGATGHALPLRHQHSGDKFRFKRFRITGVRKLGLYLSPNFSAKTRLIWYTRRPRTQQPQFIVLGKRVSRHGTARYRVRDINRQSPTYGLIGYVTTRKTYVHQTYYHLRKKLAVITVINLRGINGYRTGRFGSSRRLRHYRQGQVLRIRRIQRFKTTWRYQLTTGQFVTANKQWVARGRVTIRREWRLHLSSRQGLNLGTFRSLRVGVRHVAHWPALRSGHTVTLPLTVKWWTWR